MALTQVSSYNLNTRLGAEGKGRPSRRRNSFGGDIAAPELATFASRANAQIPDHCDRRDDMPSSVDSLSLKANSGSDCLEEKLRLLDLHRRSTLAHCERFLCDMEVAMASAEAAARASDSRQLESPHSQRQVNHAVTNRSTGGAPGLPRNASAKVNPLMAPASPSWLADVSYYGTTGRRSVSAAPSACASGASGASCLSSSGATQRRSSSRRRSWTAGCPATTPTSESGMVMGRSSNPWGAEYSPGGKV